MSTQTEQPGNSDTPDTPEPITRIEPINLFHTPTNITEVQDWIERHNPDERAHLYTSAMMTYNLMCNIHNDHTDKLKDIIRMLLDQLQEYTDNYIIIDKQGRYITIDGIKTIIGDMPDIENSDNE